MSSDVKARKSSLLGYQREALSNEEKRLVVSFVIEEKMHSEASFPGMYRILSGDFKEASEGSEFVAYAN